MARPRGFLPRRTTSKRQTAWGFGPDEVDGSIGASGSQLWTNGIILVAEINATIVRIRGKMRIQLLTATAAGDGFFGALGLCLVSTDAFVAGVASIPGPLNDLPWGGWIWHSFFDVRTITGTIADGVNAATASTLIDIDSKAMRKWGVNETLVGVIEHVESGTATAELQGDTRVLVKLS